MKEGIIYKLDSANSETFFKFYLDELYETQFFFDYTMGILDELMHENDYAYIYLSNIIKLKDKWSFAFRYIRNVTDFPIIERFFIEEKPDILRCFFSEHDKKVNSYIKPAISRKIKL